jgi:hypothetical protein
MKLHMYCMHIVVYCTCTVCSVNFVIIGELSRESIVCKYSRTGRYILLDRESDCSSRVAITMSLQISEISTICSENID